MSCRHIFGRAAAAALTLLAAGCAQSDIVCRAEPLSHVVLYDKGDFLGDWALELDVLEDTSGRLSPGPMGAPVDAWIGLPDEDFLFVRSRAEGALLGVFAVARHIDGYLDAETLCVVSPETQVEWWRRRLMRVDWSQSLVAHPALGPEDAGLRVEPVPSFLRNDDLDLLLPQFERDESRELVRFSLALRYYVSDAACPDCPGSELKVRFTFTRPGG
ncbi:MAG: hypothetical protein K8H88_29315 [Sandaracinaceae bacterium]|nr:hypothetical protein [Sandaracinaceae bacterium]